VGIDVANKVAKILAASMGDRMAESDMLDNLVKDNRTGKKSGVGFYKYDGKKRVSDPSIKSYITINEKKKLNDEDLINRMVYPMINEATRCLEEKIAAWPKDVDLGMIFGTGFAPFRGGLLTYADDEGISKVYETLQALAESDHNRFKSSSALEKIYKSGKGFYDYYQ
jgi:3-hydroxyacyl-CoA dehydrogenase/enoyl-CoA hydratase/3-hydroxybutyryl-CoA epimerase